MDSETTIAAGLSRFERRYLSGKSVWITGASSGIGRAIAARAARAAQRVIISARRVDALEALRAEIEAREASTSAEVLIVSLDLGDPASVDAALRQAREPIDLLFNCAGVSQRGCFVETELGLFRQLIEVNLVGTAALTHGVLTRMLARGSGHLVAVTSLAGLVGAPRRSGYAAAKHGLHGLFDSLRPELYGSSVAITVAVPGFVRTEISEHALRPGGRAHGELDRRQAGGMSAEACAKRIMRGVARGRAQIRVAMGGRGYLVLVLRKLAPRLLWRLMHKREQ